MPAAGLRALACVIAMLGCCRIDAGFAAQPVAPAEAAGLIHFDLPRQPLHEALQQYSAATGRSLLYDSRAITGRFSAPVSGLYSPHDALRELIAGSGLAAYYTSHEAFMLAPAPPGPAMAAGPAVDAAAQAQALRQRYFGQVQLRVMEALCGDAATAPGDYRLALRFYIDAANTVRQLEVHATGRPGLDARVRARLAGLDLRAAPPPQLRQPVTLLVVPGAGSAC